MEPEVRLLLPNEDFESRLTTIRVRCFSSNLFSVCLKRSRKGLRSSVQRRLGERTDRVNEEIVELNRTDQRGESIEINEDLRGIEVVVVVRCSSCESDGRFGRLNLISIEKSLRERRILVRSTKINLKPTNQQTREINLEETLVIDFRLEGRRTTIVAR